MSFSKIAIYMAMKSEAKSLIEELNFKSSQDLKPYGFKIYTASDEKYKIQLVVGEEDSNFSVQSVGTVPAVIATELIIRHFSPDILINAGTAGGFKSRGASIADVYIANSTQFHDRRIQIEGYQEYGRYHLKHESEYYFKALKCLECKTGMLTTGDSLDYTELDKTLVEEHKAVIKDMEGAAIAWACHHHKLPVLFIKSVTDIVDGPHPTVDEFFENLNQASINLSKTLICLIKSQCL